MPSKLSSFHENYDRKENIKIGSDKKFGITMSAVFFCFAIFPLIFNHSPHYWLFAISILFLLLAVTKPDSLKWPNIYWTKLGLLLSKIISPIVLCVLYFLTFVPMGYLLKLFNKDILSLKIESDVKSYWIVSDKNPTSMKDQF